MRSAHLLLANALRRANPAVFFTRLQGLSWYAGTQRDWIAQLGIARGAHVLEIGCGPGHLTLAMAKSGLDVVGVDRSKRMIRRATAHARARGFPAIFCMGDATSLEFPDAAFDCTLAASVINIAKDSEGVLTEMARVTRPGGLVSVLFPSDAMNAAHAAAYIDAHGLTGFSAAALQLWARLAPKLDELAVHRIAQAVPGLSHVATHRMLDGMVMAVTYQKWPARHQPPASSRYHTG